MEYKEVYDIEEVVVLFDELEDLGVDISELPDDTTLHELVQMFNRLTS